jgi:hypothetical protein
VETGDDSFIASLNEDDGTDTNDPLFGWTLQCTSCATSVPCAACRRILEPDEQLTLAMLRGVDLSNWRKNAWTRDKIYRALGKRQLQRHLRTDDGFGALVAAKVWSDDEIDGGLDRDAALPYNSSTGLVGLVALLLKVLLAEELSDDPWDTDDMVYYPSESVSANVPAPTEAVAWQGVQSLEDEAVTMANH